jgi:hypothetical protein
VNVRELRSGQALPTTPHVLSELSLVWRSVHPAAGSPCDLHNPHQTAPKACSSDLDELRAPGEPVETFSALRAFLGPFAVRPTDVDESPLSQSEAVIAMRDFPNKGAVMKISSLALIAIWSAEISATAELIHKRASQDVEGSELNALNSMLARIQSNATQIRGFLSTMEFSE